MSDVFGNVEGTTVVITPDRIDPERLGKLIVRAAAHEKSYQRQHVFHPKDFLASFTSREISVPPP